MFIEALGWDAYFEAVWKERELLNCVPARVVSQQRGLWRVAGDFKECWAEASGKLRKGSEEGGDWPAVGDWVAAEILSGQANAIIHRVLPRRSRFARKAAGKAMAEQVIAANIDMALIVAGLDGDFNLRRIERYLAQCWESGARPAIVLNKADICPEPGKVVAEIERVAMGTPVFLVSAKAGEGLDALEAHFRKWETMVMLGSSGVGKSTLVNHFLREERQRTHSVRESDSRGRHTTSSGELLMLRGGAMIIDTPGLRELQLWNAAEGMSETFREIDQLTEECRFSDCHHGNEPGCAVQAALASGIIDTGRWENWKKLQREHDFLLRKTDPKARHAEKKRIKVIMRQIKEKYKKSS